MIKPKENLRNQFLSAKTKYDMCYAMDYCNYRNIPWLHMMSLSMSEIKSVFVEFLKLL